MATLRAARRRSLPGRVLRLAAAAAALALLLAFDVWTATTNPTTYPTRLSAHGEDYYNLLTDAYLHGRLDLRLPVPPPVPGHPAEHVGPRDPHGRHDLSFFRGRYYLYWGPTPVLTAFGPARLLVVRLDERVAAALYAFGAVLAALALLRWILRRFVPGAPPAVLWLGGLALATSSALPYMLRRATVYEVAIAAGLMFMLLGILGILSGALEQRVRLGRLALGSLAIGLAAGARADLALSAIVIPVALVALARRGDVARRRSALVPAALALAGPAAACGVLLVAYNVVRFGHPLEFGQHLQVNKRQLRPSGPLPRYLLPALYAYLLAPVRWSLAFPFAHLPPPPAPPLRPPARYVVEPTGGLLANAPIVLALAGVVPLARDRAARSRGPAGVAALLAALGAALLLAVSTLVFGATMRYEADFAALLLVAALACWAALAAGAGSRGRRRAILVSGGVLVTYGALVGLAISLTGQTGGLRHRHPATYDRLERLFSPLPTAASVLVGHPVLTQVIAPAGQRAEVRYGTLGAGAHVRFSVGPAPARLEIVSPDARAARLTAGTRGRGTLLVDGRAVRPGSGGRMIVPVRLRRGLNVLMLRGGPLHLREVQLEP